MADDIAERPKLRLTRRRFLISAAAAATVAAVNAALPKSSKVTETLPQEDFPFQASIPQRPELVVPTPEQRLKAFLYQELSVEEKDALEKEINFWMEHPHINTQSDYFKTISSKIEAYSGIIDRACETVKEQVGMVIDPVWKDVLKGIIFIESKGDPHPKDDNDPRKLDKGLCQIKPGAISDAMQFLNWDKKIDIYDPQTNITLALGYLMRYSTVIENPGLLIGAFHRGPGEVLEKKNLEASATYFHQVTAASIGIIRNTQTKA